MQKQNNKQQLQQHEAKLTVTCKPYAMKIYEQINPDVFMWYENSPI